MARSRNLWGSSEEKELKRVVRNFNRKLARLEKRDHNLAAGIELILPDKVDVNELRGRIQSRADLNYELKRLQAFSKRGAEKAVIPKTAGFAITSWEKEALQKDLKRINQKRAYHRNKLESQEATLRNEPLGYTRRDLLGQERKNQLKSKSWRFNKVHSKKEWLAYRESVIDQSDPKYMEASDQRLQDNYLSGMITEGYPEEVVKLIKSVPNKKFIETYYREELAQISFVYDESELEARSESLTMIWAEESKNAFVKDLKNHGLKKKYLDQIRDFDDLEYRDFMYGEELYDLNLNDFSKDELNNRFRELLSDDE